MGCTKLFSSVQLFRNVQKCTAVIRHSTRAQGTWLTAEAESSVMQAEIGGNRRGLVIGVYECAGRLELTETAKQVDYMCGGKITQHLNIISTKLRLGKAFVLTEVMSEYSAVAITSFGRKDAGYNTLEILDERRENIRVGIGAGVSLLTRRGCDQIACECGNYPDAAAESAHLAAWRFERFKTTIIYQKPSLTLFESESSVAWETGCVLGRCQNWARYLSDMPANKMTPCDLAQEALNVLCPLGIQVTARDRHWAQAQGMEAFLAVARGSCEEPIFLQCEYRATEQPPVLLAAKGVTFDCGGLCLKSRADMVENRGSMAGAAVVLAALRAIAELKIKINVCAVIPLCENMISGQCMKVGDVVKTLNGYFVQIEDTDLEGRLMLADALVYGQALYKPQLVIDVATFTHGMVLATGGGAFGTFCNSLQAWKALQCAGARTGDRPWLFPLWNYYQRQVTDDPSVDLRNRGSGTASPCIGAAFLKKFICGDWLHLDITGVGKLAHGSAPPYLRPHRMSGRPTRTLATFLMNAATCAETPEDLCQPCPSPGASCCPPPSAPPCPPPSAQPCPPSGGQLCDPPSAQSCHPSGFQLCSPPNALSCLPPCSQPYPPPSSQPCLPPSSQPCPPPSTQPCSPPSSQPCPPPSTQPCSPPSSRPCPPPSTQPCLPPSSRPCSPPSSRPCSPPSSRSCSPPGSRPCPPPSAPSCSPPSPRPCPPPNAPPCSPPSPRPCPPPNAPPCPPPNAPSCPTPCAPKC